LEGVKRIRKSKKNRQRNGHKKKKGKQTSNGPQNTTQKTKDQTARTLLNPGLYRGAPEG